MLGTVSGNDPGMLLPGGATLPLNWDIFTDIALSLANTAIFPKFWDVLDAAGHGDAQINSPPLIAGTEGTEMHFAFTLVNPCDFASNPIELVIVP